MAEPMDVDGPSYLLPVIEVSPQAAATPQQPTHLPPLQRQQNRRQSPPWARHRRQQQSPPWGRPLGQPRQPQSPPPWGRPPRQQQQAQPQAQQEAQPQTQQASSPPSARKRSHDEFAEHQSVQELTNIFLHPPRKSGFRTLINKSRNLLSSIWGFITGSKHETEIVGVETGPTGNKRRAVEADISPRKMTETLPGSFPQVEEPQVPAEIVQPAQGPTPPNSRPGSSQKRDPPMPLTGQESQTDTVAAPISKSENAAPKQTQRAPQKQGGSSRLSGGDANKVIRYLPAPSFTSGKYKLRTTPTAREIAIENTYVSPTFIKNCRKDAEIDERIHNVKKAYMAFAGPNAAEPHIISRRTCFDIPGWGEYRVQREIAEYKEELYEEAEERERVRKLKAEKEAKKAAEKAKLKAEADAIEQQLQEEAAKQAEAVEEEKRQEALRKALEEKARLSDPEYIKKQQLIRPLDPEWATKVKHEMAVKTRAHVITKTVDGTDLTRKDFGTLLPQEGTEDNPIGWLNDEIVNGWMSSIVASKLEKDGYVKSAHNVPTYAAMSSAWYSNYKKAGGMNNIARWTRRKGIKGEKLLKCEKIFFPINTGAHWMVLIISPKARTIELLDSLNGPSKRWFLIAREWLQMELGDKYDAKEWMDLPSESSEQQNSNDCGVFACYNALAAAKGVGFEEVGKGDMRDARRAMAAILINGGFSGDYML